MSVMHRVIGREFTRLGSDQLRQPIAQPIAALATRI